MRRLLRISAALVLAGASCLTQAAGIPVIDIANLMQSIQQVMNDITKIQNQMQQINQLQSQLASINGSRGLGTVLYNPLISNYVPPQAYTIVNAVNTGGYSGLTGAAKAMRDATMIYNCMDLPGAVRTSCQATLAQPYQQKALVQGAMNAAAGRLAQIQALMRQVNATTDQKAILELHARIAAEGALLAHEATQLQMLQGIAESEERIARSREREHQYEMVRRTGRIVDRLTTTVGP